MTSPRVGLLLLSALISACGANVVFDEDAGNGGSGADAPGAGNAGANDEGGSTSTFNTTVGALDACEELCILHPQCFENDCVQSCRELYVPGCEAEADFVARCLTEGLSATCDLGQGTCSGEIFGYQECTGTGECFTDFCAESPSGCQCDGFCVDALVEQTCELEDGQVRCACYLADNFVGECVDDSLVCSIEDGCCRALFELGVHRPQHTAPPSTTG